MKSVVGTSGNVLAGPDGEGGYEPLCEAVLVLSEPRYEADAGGYVKRHVPSEVRFGGTPDSIRKVAEALTKLADAADREWAEFVSKTSGDKT